MTQLCRPSDEAKAGNSSRTPLVRAVGLLSLTAIAINGMIGSGIFVLPATVAKLLGPLSPLAYLISGVAIVLIVLCFAEVGSRFERAGGPYLYAREAFGSFIGFEVGWMFLLARLTAFAAISNAFTAYLGYFWPLVGTGIGRVLAISASLSALTAINLFGVRYSAWLVNLLTVGKLLPLLLLATIGLFFVDGQHFSVSGPPEMGALRQASLVLIFAFGGFEFASVPTEEVLNPRRNLGLALIAAVTLTGTIYILIQIVALGTVPQLATASAPLASAAQRILGVTGAAVVTAGAVLSTTGTNGAVVLVGSRILYAMADGGQLPAALARVHPRYRTPHISVIAFALAAWALAMYSNFAQLAAVSAMARLLFYLSTCLAVPVLRRKMSDASRQFTVPGGLLVPVAAAVICLWLLSGSTQTQAAVGGVALLLGAAIYGLQSWSKTRGLDTEKIAARSKG
jgi:amino acid transporter